MLDKRNATVFQAHFLLEFKRKVDMTAKKKRKNLFSDKRWLVTSDISVIMRYYDSTWVDHRTRTRDEGHESKLRKAEPVSRSPTNVRPPLSNVETFKNGHTTPVASSSLSADPDVLERVRNPEQLASFSQDEKQAGKYLDLLLCSIYMNYRQRKHMRQVLSYEALYRSKICVYLAMSMLRSLERDIGLKGVFEVRKTAGSTSAVHQINESLDTEWSEFRCNGVLQKLAETFVKRDSENLPAHNVIQKRVLEILQALTQATVLASRYGYHRQALFCAQFYWNTRQFLRMYGYIKTEIFQEQCWKASYQVLGAIYDSMHNLESKDFNHRSSNLISPSAQFYLGRDEKAHDLQPFNLDFVRDLTLATMEELYSAQRFNRLSSLVQTMPQLIRSRVQSEAYVMLKSVPSSHNSSLVAQPLLQEELLTLEARAAAHLSYQQRDALHFEVALAKYSQVLKGNCDRETTMSCNDEIGDLFLLQKDIPMATASWSKCLDVVFGREKAMTKLGEVLYEFNTDIAGFLNKTAGGNVVLRAAIIMIKLASFVYRDHLGKRAELTRTACELFRLPFKLSQHQSHTVLAQNDFDLSHWAPYFMEYVEKRKLGNLALFQHATSFISREMMEIGEFASLFPLLSFSDYYLKHFAFPSAMQRDLKFAQVKCALGLGLVNQAVQIILVLINGECLNDGEKSFVFGLEPLKLEFNDTILASAASNPEVLRRLLNYVIDEKLSVLYGPDFTQDLQLLRTEVVISVITKENTFSKVVIGANSSLVTKRSSQSSSANSSRVSLSSTSGDTVPSILQQSPISGNDYTTAAKKEKKSKEATSLSDFSADLLSLAVQKLSTAIVSLQGHLKDEYSEVENAASITNKDEEINVSSGQKSKKELRNKSKSKSDEMASTLKTYGTLPTYWCHLNSLRWAFELFSKTLVLLNQENLAITQLKNILTTFQEVSESLEPEDTAAASHCLEVLDPAEWLKVKFSIADLLCQQGRYDDALPWIQSGLIESTRIHSPTFILRFSRLRLFADYHIASDIKSMLDNAFKLIKDGQSMREKSPLLAIQCIECGADLISKLTVDANQDLIAAAYDECIDILRAYNSTCNLTLSTTIYAPSIEKMFVLELKGARAYRRTKDFAKAYSRLVDLITVLKSYPREGFFQITAMMELAELVQELAVHDDGVKSEEYWVSQMAENWNEALRLCIMYRNWDFDSLKKCFLGLVCAKLNTDRQQACYFAYLAASLTKLRLDLIANVDKIALDTKTNSIKSLPSDLFADLETWLYGHESAVGDATSAAASTFAPSLKEPVESMIDVEIDALTEELTNRLSKKDDQTKSFLSYFKELLKNLPLSHDYLYFISSAMHERKVGVAHAHLIANIPSYASFVLSKDIPSLPLLETLPHKFFCVQWVPLPILGHVPPTTNFDSSIHRFLVLIYKTSDQDFVHTCIIHIQDVQTILTKTTHLLFTLREHEITKDDKFLKLAMTEYAQTLEEVLRMFGVSVDRASNAEVRFSFYFMIVSVTYYIILRRFRSLLNHH